MTNILVLGGMNVDHHIFCAHEPDDDGSERILYYCIHPGGHAANCAYSLARVGAATVTTVGTVGNDSDGKLLLDNLARAGVDISHTRVLPNKETGRVFITHFGQKKYMLMDRGANDFDDVLPLPAIDMYDAIVLFDCNYRTAHAVIEVCRLLEKLVVWNPGGLIITEDWLQDLSSGIDTVILNASEYSILHGNSKLPKPSNLIMTKGVLGCELNNSHGCIDFQAYHVDSVDASGAGDAFTAVYALLRAQGMSLESAIKAASYGGAMSTRSVGSQTSVINEKELAKFLEGIG